MSDGTTGHCWDKLADARAECVRLNARVADHDAMVRRIVELEAVIAAAIAHASAKGMGQWPVFAKMRKALAGSTAGSRKTTLK